MTIAGRTLAATPTFQWNLSETSGTSFADATGNGHSGSVVSGTPNDAAGPIDYNGDLGVQLNGGSIQGTIAGPAAGSAVTLLGWAHIDSLPASGANNLFGWSNSGLFYIDSTGAIIWYDDNGGSGADYGIFTTGTANTAFAVGSTHFLAATIDSSNVLTMYLDGLQVPFHNETDSLDLGIGMTGTATHRIASTTFGCGAISFLGTAPATVGIIAGFTRVLSAAEIASIWTTTMPPRLHTVQQAALTRAANW